MSNFLKTGPLGAKLFCADRWMDRQTDRTQLIVTFHNFANMPKTKDFKNLLLKYTKVNGGQNVTFFFCETQPPPLSREHWHHLCVQDKRCGYRHMETANLFKMVRNQSTKTQCSNHPTTDMTQHKHSQCIKIYF